MLLLIKEIKVKSKTLVYPILFALYFTSTVFAATDGDVADAEFYGEAYKIIRDMKQEEKEKEEREAKEEKK